MSASLSETAASGSCCSAELSTLLRGEPTPCVDRPCFAFERRSFRQPLIPLLSVDRTERGEVLKLRSDRRVALRSLLGCDASLGQSLRVPDVEPKALRKGLSAYLSRCGGSGESVG